MCFNKEASRNSFIIGFGSSLLLLLFGDQLILKLIGFTFIFISFMQIIDYMIWNDIDCKTGKNILASKLGLLLIYIQPLLILLILLIRKPAYKNIIIAINLLYLFYLSYLFTKYLQKTDICSKMENGRSKWNFLKYGDSNYLNYLYPLLFVFNILLLVRQPYEILAVGLFVGTYLLSYFNYKYHMGEIWCYLANSIPLIILIVNKLKLL